MENKFTVSFTDDELATVLSLLHAKVKDFRREHDYYINIDTCSFFDAEEIKNSIDFYSELIAKYDCIIDKIHLTLDFEGILINGDVPF